ncbi:MAG: Rieske (2Fe-2S) protein [Patescibacteria group bacterium]
MASFIKAARVSEVNEGQLKTISVGGKVIALAKVGGEFFALDDTCTHAGCSLGNEGILEGEVVTCGCHGAKFGVKSGKALALPAATDVATYKVKVENDDIYVAV